MDGLKLIDPIPDLAQEFLAMAAEWRDAGQDKFKDAFGDFRSYVAQLQAATRANDLPAGWVPGNTYWLVTVTNRIVGTSRLRHWLVPHLEKEGGHIGYDVRPSERRMGYGTALLRLTLQKAHALGLREVIVTCDSDNMGSVRIIEKNGGLLFAVATSDRTGKEIRRYRIMLAGQDEREAEPAGAGDA